MKSAAKNQSRKVAYLGTSAHITYTGSFTQPGHVGNHAGTKLAVAAGRSRLGNSRGGVVSRAYENIAKSKRVAV